MVEIIVKIIKVLETKAYCILSLLDCSSGDVASLLLLIHLFPAHQEIQATWYEKLHEWEDALVAYDKKIDMNKEDPELILGRMRCLEALGEW